MKKKTLKALKAFAKLSPTEKVAATAFGVAVFPIALTLGTYQQWKKKKYTKRRKRY